MADRDQVGMTPEQWAQLTPQQQAWHHEQWQQWQLAQARQQGFYSPPAPARVVPSTNVAVIVSVTAGLLALLVLPVVLGLIGVFAGVVGEHVSRKTGGPGNRLSIFGILLGLFDILVMSAL